MAVFRKPAVAESGTGPSPKVWNKIPAEVLGNSDPSKGWGFFTDFLAVGTANAGGTTLIDESGPWIASAVANAGDIENVEVEGGVMWLETAGTENDGMQVQKPEAYVIDSDSRLAFGVRLGPVDADQGEICVALTTVDSDVAGSQANDYVGFVSADEDASIKYLVQTGGAGVATDTGVDFADTTTSTMSVAKNLEVYIEGENLVQMYIDGVLVATVTGDTAASITDGIPTDTVMGLAIAHLTGENVANGIYADWAYCYQWFAGARS